MTIIQTILPSPIPAPLYKLAAAAFLRLLLASGSSALGFPCCILTRLFRTGSLFIFYTPLTPTNTIVTRTALFAAHRGLPAAHRGLLAAHRGLLD